MPIVRPSRIFRNQPVNDRAEDTDEETKLDHVWSSEEPLTTRLMAVAIQGRLKALASDMLVTENKLSLEFKIGEKESVSFVAVGSIAYVIDGCLVIYEISVPADRQGIRASTNLAAIVDDLKTYIRLHNPFRGKHLLFGDDRGRLDAQILPRPSSNWTNISLPGRMSEDIQDNTIFQLAEVKQCGGVLLYGPPGTGKSMICQAVINDATGLGFTACTLYGALDFTALRTFIEEFLSPCVVVFEDVDGFAESRIKTGRNPGLSSFLQFLSGIQSWREPVVTVATTNYVELLDEAVANRPLRFNRRYHIGLPEPAVIDRILDSLFSDMALTPELRALCHDPMMTGAHLAEIRRTALTFMKRRNEDLPAVFQEAVVTVKAHFTAGQRPAGFGFRTAQS